MQDFLTLIRELIGRRYGGSESRLADALGVNRSSVHRVVAGEKKLSLKAIDAWADALALEGEERADFSLAAEVASSPASVRERINELESLLERISRESARAHAKMTRAVAELRAEPAPRRPSR